MNEYVLLLSKVSARAPIPAFLKLLDGWIRRKHRPKLFVKTDRCACSMAMELWAASGGLACYVSMNDLKACFKNYPQQMTTSVNAANWHFDAGGGYCLVFDLVPLPPACLVFVFAWPVTRNAETVKIWQLPPNGSSYLLYKPSSWIKLY